MKKDKIVYTEKHKNQADKPAGWRGLCSSHQRRSAASPGSTSPTHLRHGGKTESGKNPPASAGA